MWRSLSTRSCRKPDAGTIRNPGAGSRDQGTIRTERDPERGRSATPERDPGNPGAGSRIPGLEVTIDSTEEYDIGDKLDAYRTIPSLREVIIVAHRERRITVHRRDAGGEWAMRAAIGGGRIAIESLGAELSVDTIYRNSSVS